MQISYPERKGRVKAVSAADGENILTFVNAAFRDYMAARVLLLSGLTVQGAVLASTAIEKYLKALLAYRGNRSRGHLKRAHLNAFKNYDPQFYELFNEEFFLFLQKIYRLRYPDALPKGFSAVIARRELVAELDHTAIRLNGSFRPIRGGQRVATLLDQFHETEDDRLLDENHVFKQIDKQAFIAATHDVVYEMRITDNGLYLELEYVSEPASSDGKFLREGLRTNGGAAMFVTAFKMAVPSSDATPQASPQMPTAE